LKRVRVPVPSTSRNYGDSGGYIVPPKFRTCITCTSQVKDAAYVKILSMTLTTRLYEVRTNLYPPPTYENVPTHLSPKNTVQRPHRMGRPSLTPEIAFFWELGPGHSSFLGPPKFTSRTSRSVQPVLYFSRLCPADRQTGRHADRRTDGRTDGPRYNRSQATGYHCVHAMRPSNNGGVS